MFANVMRCSLHGFADVIELQIKKDSLPLRKHILDELRSAGSIEFHSYFVEVTGIPQLSDEIASVRRTVQIECDDQRICVCGHEMSSVASSLPAEYADATSAKGHSRQASRSGKYNPNQIGPATNRDTRVA